MIIPSPVHLTEPGARYFPDNPPPVQLTGAGACYIPDNPPPVQLTKAEVCYIPNNSPPMQITGWAVPPEQNPTEVQELCLELCLELLSSGLAPRPLHAHGQQGESSPHAAPVGCAGAGGFCSPVGCLFGSSSRVKIQPRWYFQFVFLRGGADAIGCSRSPSVTSGFFFIFFSF